MQKLVELGITTGCTNTTYCPDAPVTRGQMAVFVIRARLGVTSADGFRFPSAYFTDVPAGDIFFSYVQKMRDLGIRTGCSATTYCPNDSVSRAEMAPMILRALYGAP